MPLPTITTVEADAYFATTPRAAAWSAVTAPDTQLTEAATWLASLCWDETADCCGNDFAAAYTRAVSELALALSTNPTALIGGSSTTAGTFVKRQKLGDLEVELDQFAVGTAGSRAVGSKGPLVLRTFPWLRDIIGCWVRNAGSNQLVYRVRS